MQEMRCDTDETKLQKKFTQFIQSVTPIEIFSQKKNLEFINPVIEKKYDDFTLSNFNGKVFNICAVISSCIIFLYLLMEILMFHLFELSVVLFSISIIQLLFLFISIVILLLKNSLKLKKWIVFLNNASIHLNVIIMSISFTIFQKGSLQQEFERNITLFVFYLCFVSGCHNLLFPYDKFWVWLIPIIFCLDMFVFLFILFFQQTYPHILFIIPYWIFVLCFISAIKYNQIQLRRNIFINSFQSQQNFHNLNTLLNKSNSIVYIFKKRDLIFQSINGEQLGERFMNSVAYIPDPPQKLSSNAAFDHKHSAAKFKETIPTEMDKIQISIEISALHKLSSQTQCPTLSLTNKRSVVKKDFSCIDLLFKKINLNCNNVDSNFINFEGQNNDMIQMLTKEYVGKKKVSLKKVLKYLSQRTEDEIGIEKVDKFEYLGQCDLELKNNHLMYEVFIKINFQQIVENKKIVTYPLIQFLLNDITEKIKNENEKLEHIKTKKHFTHLIHEFKTPLNSIISSADQITEAVASRENLRLNSLVSNISSLSHYVQFLIKDIIDISQGRGYSFHFTQVHLSEIMKFCYNVLTSLISLSEAKQRNIKPILDQDDLRQKGGGDLMFFTDETRLKQILLNLISNSVKFTSRGYIELKASLSDCQGKFYITVRDTGSGIKEEDQAWLFRQDTKIDQSINNQFGSGLGLAISKKIANKLGIAMEMDSLWQKGTVFRLTIDRSDRNGKVSRSIKCDNSPLLNSLANEIKPKKIISRHTHTALNTIYTKNLTNDIFNIGDRGELKDQNTVRTSRRVEFSYNHPDIISFFAHEQKSPNQSQREILDLYSGPKRNSINESNSKGILGLGYPQNKNNNELEVIIVIDDLKDARRSFVNIINVICTKNRRSYLILDGSDGIDCLKIVTEHCSKVRCLLMDENMEYLGGSETGRILKHLMDNNKINKFPIIEISSGSKKECCHPYDLSISKPVDKSKLEELFKKMQIL